MTVPTEYPTPQWDTGAHLFMDRQHYYRQIDDLAINLCVARKISDEHWTEFLENSVSLSNMLLHNASVTITAFVHAYPSAIQRRFTAEFLKNNKVPVVTRTGLVSDSPLVRGASVAFNWIIPGSKVRCFAARDFASCLTWLREAANFDLLLAIAAWTEAQDALGVR